jgi:(p)ppGpp synthase/HD superfamily hydrolase
MNETPVAGVLRALAFAAHKHRDQRRKGAGAPPFINHAIEVAEILTSRAGVTDVATLQSAVLHDTLEDTDTTPEEIEAEFGTEVRMTVQEVTDDKTRSGAERRDLQVAGAPALSHRAKLIRLADKVVNIESVVSNPPIDWTVERRRDYLNWTRKVVAGCRGCNPSLERLYDDTLRRGLEAICSRSARGSGPRVGS